ncbi:putative ABC transporter ATP-binding protein [Rickettsiales endosymbiont of Trichoplax sp. H2]|nr:putative ABC transporter ATP-binding protein [Rickettsiales endosymbiont of Trichoplax sp. H2]
MVYISAARDWCSIKYLFKFQSYIVSRFIDNIDQYAYSFFQNHTSGTILAKAQDVFNLIPTIIGTVIYQFIYIVFSTLITLIFLAQVHILFVVVMLIWMSIFFIITYFGIKKVRPITSEFAETRSKIWGHLSDYLSNILNVKCFVMSSWENSKLSNISQIFISKAEQQGYFLMKFYVIQGVIVSIYTIGFLIGLIYLHREGIISPGDFALVFMLNFTLFTNLYNLSYNLQEFIINCGTVNQALKILELPKEVQDKPDATKLVLTKGEIEFSNVQFNYKGTTELFKNKSIIIKGGQKVSLVGHSGGGKTTFSNLILRLFDVTSGEILIDGQNIKKVTQDSLRAAISIIPQESLLFHRTIEENIGYGNLNASEYEIIEAAKKAHAHEFIKKLPYGYKSLIGERGGKLSGGQRQRIVIARAILKNAPIVILDEATSQLDLETENKIQESLKELMKGKTSIVIAHRLSTLLGMDRVLVFEHGKIIKDGTYEELFVNKSSIYKRL